MRPSEVHEAVKFALSNQHKTRITPFVWGPPGAGKSDVIEQVAKELDATLIDIRLSEHDASEIKGIDMPDSKKGALVRYLPEYLQAIDNKKRTVLFFDEANSGHPSTQPPLYKITNNRVIGNYKLPDTVSIVLAGNKETDRAITTKMSSALGNRLAHITFEVNQEDLCNWAIANNTHPELIAFWRFRPELIHCYNPDSKAWPSPRSWDRANYVIHSGLSRSTEFELLQGIVGEGPAGEFAAFMNVWRDMPSVDQILVTPKDVKVPNDPATLYALSTALAVKAAKDNADRIMTYVERLPKEFQVVYIRDSVRRKAGIETSKSFIKWSIDNADVLG